MKNRFVRAALWLGRNYYGKTWWVFWVLSVLMLFVGGDARNTLNWMFLFLAYQFQGMANQARTRPELQKWFDEVNADRIKRIHQERIAAVLTAHGMRSERATSISVTTVEVLDLAQYRFATV